VAAVRFSATTLDVFARYLAGRKTEAELLTYIRRETPPTERMRFGGAWTRILEDPDAHVVPGGFACDGFRFEAADVEPALALIDRRRDLLEVAWTTAYGPHTVSCRADLVRGREVVEFKARLGAYHSAHYHASWQWRFALEVFDAVSVTYRVFRFTKKRRRLAAIHELPLTRTRTLAADCARLVDRFAGYVTARGLAHHFVDRPQGALYVPRDHTRREEAHPQQSVPLFRDPIQLPPPPPLAALPDPAFVLRPYPGGRARQTHLFR
jgi:hypothetical protein